MTKLLIGVVLLFAASVKPQQPTSYRLNLEASKALMELETARESCIKSVAEKQHWILVGAGVPADSRHCSPGRDGIVTCTKAEKAKQENESLYP